MSSEREENKESIAKCAAKTAAACVGAIACMTGAVVGAGIALEKVQENLVEGLQAAYSGGSTPVMVSPAKPLQSQPAEVGPTVKDYAVPGAIALTELGVAGYGLWRLNRKTIVKPGQGTVIPDSHDSCELSPKEVEAFASIIQREFRQS